MLITSEGHIAAHGSKPELAKENAELSASTQTLIRRIQSNDTAFYATGDDGEPELFIAQPAKLQGSDSSWHLVSALPKNIILLPFTIA